MRNVTGGLGRAVRALLVNPIGENLQKVQDLSGLTRPDVIYAIFSQPVYKAMPRRQVAVCIDVLDQLKAGRSPVSIEEGS